MDAKIDGNSPLRFLQASRVGCPAGDLGSLQLQSETDEPLGTLDGVLIDPRARQVRYFVVQTPGWFRSRKYLVPADLAAQVEPERRTLRLDIGPDDLKGLDEFKGGAVRDFSMEDAVDAIFSPTS